MPLWGYSCFYELVLRKVLYFLRLESFNTGFKIADGSFTFVFIT